MLFGAVSQLHQAELVEPPHGNAACQRRLRHGARARSHLHVFRQLAQLANLFLDVERRVVYRRQAQLPPGFERRTAHGLFLIAHRHAKQPFLQRLAGPAETDRRSGPRLQLQRHVLQDVGQIGAAAQALEETAPPADAATMFDHLGQPAHHAIIEAGHLVRRAVLQVTQFNPGLEHREAVPDVGATHRKNLPKFHIHAVSRSIRIANHRGS